MVCISMGIGTDGGYLQLPDRDWVAENETAGAWVQLDWAEGQSITRIVLQLVGEDLNGKLKRMPEEAREKLRETLQRIINEGSGGALHLLIAALHGGHLGELVDEVAVVPDLQPAPLGDGGVKQSPAP